MAAERTSPQSRINIRSLEVVSELRGDLAGHKELDAMQFANVRAELTEIKSDIKQLSTDAKGAIDLVAKQNADNHRTNTDTLQKLTVEVAGIAQRSEAERGIVNFVLRNIPTGVGILMLIYTVWWRK